MHKLILQKQQLDKDILYDLYVNKNFKAEEVAIKVGRCSVTVLKYLKQFNIPIKGIRHYLLQDEICFNGEQYEFFDGLMASDGSLTRQVEKHRNRNAMINCKFKHKEFAEYINGRLDMGCDVRKYTHVSERYKSGKCDMYILYSKHNALFTKERDRWYPGNKKRLPDDFRFSPTSMNIMYLGDGCFSRKAIVIATDSFSRENIEKVLVSKINSLGIDVKIQKDNRLVFGRAESIKFLEYIGDCPVKCYQYKWDM